MSKMFQSINPFDGKLTGTHTPHDITDINRILEKSDQAFRNWRLTTMEEKSQLMRDLGQILSKEKDKLGRIISREMGKILRESIAEIEKCAWLCDHYAQYGPEMLETESAPSDGTVSYIRFEPVGVIYAIMPWNFPFWQVLRFAVPTILAGNAVVLKHAPNVLGCAKEIESLFREAGFPKNLFSNLFIPVDLSDTVIAHPLVRGVTLTGSQKAGKAVAAQAGKYLKKTVLELGGSDPYIVLADADFQPACETAVNSRMLNTGQVCIAAKRFIVERKIFDRFTEELKIQLENLKWGDPLDEGVDLGPMARPDLLETVNRQVTKSLEMGATLITGGKVINDRFYAPTLLTHVQKGMPVYDEETFGPVSVVIPAGNAEEAVRISNDTSFGLGASIWTRNLELAEQMAGEIEAGAVFINGMTKSDPRLPFGGTKMSGYGRELSHFGIREFVNIKTVWFK
ncbi:MAG: NAD-dependent succinate-semialdehyde dehydrogenase [bacterium]